MAELMGLDTLEVSIMKFHNAVQAGNLPVVVDFLMAGMHPDAVNHYCGTALHGLNTCRNNAADIVNALIQAGANPNQQYGKRKETPLHVFAFSGAEEAAGALIAAGADVSIQDGTKNRWTPFQVALSRGHIGVARLLFQAGADPLYQGVGSTCGGLCGELWETGADFLLNEVGLHPDCQRWRGETALQISCRRFQLPIIEALLAAGADPSLRCGKGDIAADFLSRAHARNPTHRPAETVALINRLTRDAKWWSRREVILGRLVQRKAQ